MSAWFHDMNADVKPFHLFTAVASQRLNLSMARTTHEIAQIRSEMRRKWKNKL